MDAIMPFATPAEARQELKNFPEWEPVCSGKVQYPNLADWPDALTAEWVDSNFLKAPMGVGRPDKLSIMTVDSVCDGLSDEQKAIGLINRGDVQFAVASVMLWYALIPEGVRTWLEQHPLHRIPIAQWKDLGEYFDDGRQSAHYGGDFGDLAFLHLRKIKNLVGRSLDEADWAKEVQNIMHNDRWRRAPTNSGRLSRGRWLLMVFDALDELAEQIVVGTVANGHLQTMEEWWAQRSLWCPSGSSSERHKLDEYKERDSNLHSSDRPTKKSVVEAVKYEELLSHLHAMPVALARASTKHEPGFKQRALYASDDWSTHIASYASQDVEKHMDIGGMVAKQTPRDVVDWMRSDLARNRRPGSVWLSLDYSDFNKEQENTVLAYLNVAFAKAWLRRVSAREACLQRATASLWVAYSHFNSWIQFPTAAAAATGMDVGSPMRSWHGLWSGHRNTARDNTICHKAYSMVVQRLCFDLMGIDTGSIYMGICGDDEDALMRNWLGLAAYVGMHNEVGHALNPVKQMVGYTTHEFLQRQAIMGQPPSRPLPATIATIASGNWYKDPGHYFDTAVRSLSDNGWEMVCRGADSRLVQRLISKMLDFHMRTTGPSGNTVLLEWWAYRNSGGTHPLWEGTSRGGIAEDECPKIKVPYNTRKMPESGIQDLMRTRWRWFQHLQEGQRSAWKDELSRDVHKAYYGRFGERSRMQMALELWPRRSSRPRLSTQPKPKFSLPTAEQLACTIAQEGGERQPPKLDTSLQRIGLDTKVFYMLGGWAGVARHGRPEDMSAYEQEMVIQPELIPEWAHCTDPAILSWLKSRHN